MSAKNIGRHGGDQVKDILGQRFGRLVVVERALKWPGRSYAIWKCKCDCGGIKECPGISLRSGFIKSCGCLYDESRKDGSRKKITHGCSGKGKTKEYSCWASMIQRTTNPKNNSYADYGARGIKVCERWRSSFQNFISDMGTKPSLDHSLERKDVNGDYSPENCCWAGRITQARNRRSNRFIQFKGQNKTIAEWAKQCGFGYYTLLRRIKDGWTPERAITQAQKSPTRKEWSFETEAELTG